MTLVSNNSQVIQCCWMEGHSVSSEAVMQGPPWPACTWAWLVFHFPPGVQFFTFKARALQVVFFLLCSIRLAWLSLLFIPEWVPPDPSLAKMLLLCAHIEHCLLLPWHWRVHCRCLSTRASLSPLRTWDISHLFNFSNNFIDVCFTYDSSLT